jgi:hypothetical protein
MLVSMPAMREFYEYFSNKECNRLGVNCWVIIAMIFTEVLICIKFCVKPYILSNLLIPFPPNIWVPWVIFIFLGLIWMILFFSIKRKNRILNIFLNSILTIQFISLNFMFISGLPHIEFGKEFFNQKFESLTKLINLYLEK